MLERAARTFSFLAFDFGTQRVGVATGSTLLGLEDAGSRMARLGASEIARGGAIPVAQVLAHVAAVTLDDVRRVASGVLTGPRAMVAVGPVDDRSL